MRLCARERSLERAPFIVPPIPIMQGIHPQGIEKIQDQELREFVELCILHDPEQRPEARQLLKHSFFDAVRDPASVRKNLGGCLHTAQGCSAKTMCETRECFLGLSLG